MHTLKCCTRPARANFTSIWRDLNMQSRPTPTPQRPLMCAGSIWPCRKIHDLKQRKRVCWERRERAYLRRRFLSCTLGCRLRVRVSEIRQNPGTGYGKSAVCRWHKSHAFHQYQGLFIGIDPPRKSDLTDWLTDWLIVRNESPLSDQRIQPPRSLQALTRAKKRK